MIKLFLIGGAGFLGTLGRYWISETLGRRYAETFPVGTLAVNLGGCFLAGLLFYLMHERYSVNHLTRTAVFVGLLGGFTTFSSFGLQSFTLLRNHDFLLATLNLIGSNVCGLLLVWVGYSLGKALL
jgi:CrcB protein